MAEIPEPKTRLEQYWAGILDKIDGGGGGSTLVDKAITANGEYDPADDNADGYSGVTVAVPQTTIEPLTVNSNGTTTAPAGTAYSPVTVEYQHPSSLTKSYQESLSMLEKDVIPQLTDEFRSVYNKKISPTFNEVLAYFFSD